MSYNGSGTFNINSAGQPVVTGTVITSTAFNALTADLATGLSTALTKDGQTTPTANIPMGTYKITGLGAGTVATDAVRLSQLQNGGTTTYITAAGTDTITGTVTPALTAYATGQQFSFVVAATNTTAVTLNVDGVGAKAVTRTGSVALVAGDMVIGQVVIVEYDGTRFQLINGNSFTNLKASGTLGVTGVATLGNGAILGTPASGILTSCTGINYDGFKNRVINGAMGVDQRNAAASQTFTAAAALAYSVDRWYGYCTGANVTGQQVAGSTTPTNTQFRYKFTGAASVTAVGFGQRIEQKNSYDLAGSTCTLSADLAISATLTTVTWTASYATTTADTFGSLASPTVTQIATGTFTVSATVTNFNAQITVPAAATTGIQIVFTVGALTAGLTWTIGNVQLEKGSTATSFDYRSIGTELDLCQRYCQVYGRVSSSCPMLGQCYSLSAAYTGYQFIATMRSAPTLTYSALSDWSANTAAAAVSLLTAWSIANATTRNGEMFFTGTGSPYIAGNSTVLQAQNANATFTLSSEL